METLQQLMQLPSDSVRLILGLLGVKDILKLSMASHSMDKKSLFTTINVVKWGVNDHSKEKEILASSCFGISDLTVSLPVYSTAIEKIMRNCGSKLAHIRITYSSSVPSEHIAQLVDYLDSSRLETFEVKIPGDMERLHTFIECNTFSRLRSIDLPFSCISTPDKWMPLAERLPKVEKLGVALDPKNDLLPATLHATLECVSKFIQTLISRNRSVKFLRFNGGADQFVALLFRRLIPDYADADPFIHGAPAANHWDHWREKYFPSISATNIRLCGRSILEAAIYDYRMRVRWAAARAFRFDAVSSLIERFHGNDFGSERSFGLLRLLVFLADLERDDAMNFFNFILSKLPGIDVGSRYHISLAMAIKLGNPPPAQPRFPDLESIKQRVVDELASAFVSLRVINPPHMGLIRSARPLAPLLLLNERYGQHVGDLFPSGISELDLKNISRQGILAILQSPHVNVFAPVTRQRRYYYIGQKYKQTIFHTVLRWKRAGWLYEGDTLVQVFERRFSSISQHPSVLECVLEFTPFIKKVIASERLRQLVVQLLPDVASLLRPRFIKYLISTTNLFLLEELVRLIAKIPDAASLPENLENLLADKTWLAAVELRFQSENVMKQQFDYVKGYFPRLPTWIGELTFGLRKYPLLNRKHRDKVVAVLHDIV